ncbi:MAG: ABC transporter substrate-binding protein [Thermoleophilaceae bacterium]
MSKLRKALAGACALALVLAGLVAAAAQGQEEGGADDGKQVVFDVGDPQGIDSMSPLIGVTVAAYEAWNIQYATLTDKAAKDFSITPGLAKSWEGSENGKTWTYKLRPNMKWSDGKPLTAEDIAWTVNTSREEEWFNHFAVTQNLTAKALDDTTLEIKSSVPDPKLPVMDVYILPKHIWGKMSADERTKYEGTDGVGSGPFTLEEFNKGQFARFKANPNYWGGKPAVDKVVLRKYNNPDAMVAALKTGELDAAETIPSSSFKALQKDDSIETVEGYQGAMTEIAINGGDGLKKPHPALLDPKVREAIGHAIDRDTLVNRVESGFAQPLQTLSTSPDPKWTPDLGDGQIAEFDLDRANAILDEAGYEDTDGDGVREMPGGGQPLNFKYMVRSDSVSAQPVAEFFTGWLDEIGIATTRKVVDDSQLTTIIGKGDYDMFFWGWTPFVDPDTMLSYFQCNQVASDPENPTDYYNDANYCDPEYDKLYEQQKVELDDQKRIDIVHEMLERQAGWGVYQTLYVYPDLQAYVKDRFTGFVRQPEGNGPVIYSNTSPSYARLKPVSATASGGDDGGGGSGGIIAIAAVAVLAVGVAAFMFGRRRTADDRE